MTVDTQTQNTSATSSEHKWLSRAAKISPDMTFNEAGDLWFDSRTRRERARQDGALSNTLIDYKRKLASAKLFFGPVRLCDIRMDYLRSYQQARLAGAEPFLRYRRPQDAKARCVNGVTIPAKGKTPCPAKPQQVNQEIAFVIRILRAARLWSEELSSLHEPLIEEIDEIPRALTGAETEKWLLAASSHPRWSVVYWYSLLAFDTCMSTNEIRALRLGDIHSASRALTVPKEGAKNRFRHRTMAINSDEAVWALECLMKRAHDLGSSAPHHHLFPFIVTRSKKAYPDRPMTSSGLKKLWQEVRKASGLTWFRMYDTRHTAITRYIESGVALAAVMDRAGHISPRMTAHYTHLSEGYRIHELSKAKLPARKPSPDQIAIALDSRTSQAAPGPDEVIGQLLRALQEQCGLSSEQIREALLAQAGDHPSHAPLITSFAAS